VRSNIADFRVAREPEPVFVPAVVEHPEAQGPSSGPAERQTDVIEIAIGGATVRVRGRVDARALAAVIKALRGTS
jgi:hypothetical protein